MKNAIAIVMGTVVWLGGYQSTFAQGNRAGGLPALTQRVTALESTVVDLLAENAGQQEMIADLVKQNQEILNRVACVSGASGTNDFIFNGCNVHIRNGGGITNSINGFGNLIVGYNAPRVNEPNKTGSHNLVVGDNHNYSQFGGLVVGFQNAIASPWASVSGGSDNTAGGPHSSISGGEGNTTREPFTSVSGGWANRAENRHASVSGGVGNRAFGEASSVSGGENNEARALSSSILGSAGQIATVEGQTIPDLP